MGSKKIMSNAEEEEAVVDNPYDPNAAAELFFAHQKAREEARSKLPTDDWIQAIRIRMMNAKMKKGDADGGVEASISSTCSSSPELFLSQLVTTMPPLPQTNPDGTIDLNTADTFISCANTADNEGGGEKTMLLTPEENETRRRIMEVLVQQLEEDMLSVPSLEKDRTVEDIPRR